MSVPECRLIINTMDIKTADHSRRILLPCHAGNSTPAAVRLLRESVGNGDENFARDENFGTNGQCEAWETGARIFMRCKLTLYRLIWRPRTKPENPMVPLVSFRRSYDNHQSDDSSVKISDVLPSVVSSEQGLALNGESMEHPLHGILSEIASISDGKEVTCIVLKPQGGMEYDTSCLRAEEEFHGSKIHCLFFTESADNGFDMGSIIKAAKSLSESAV